MSTEAKLAQMLSEMNESKRGGDAGKLVCETECTMARIRSYSDFLYILRVKPLQTVCYYGAGAFLLLTLSALWCREWLLAVIFAVIFIILATLPHNMRIQYFNRRADEMEQSYGKVINAEFGGEDITLKIPPLRTLRSWMKTGNLPPAAPCSPRTTPKQPRYRSPMPACRLPWNVHTAFTSSPWTKKSARSIRLSATKLSFYAVRPWNCAICWQKNAENDLKSKQKRADKNRTAAVNAKRVKVLLLSPSQRVYKG